MMTKDSDLRPLTYTILVDDEVYAFANKWLNYPDNEIQVIDLAIALQHVLDEENGKND